MALSLPTLAEALGGAGEEATTGGAGEEEAPVEAPGVSLGVGACFLIGFTPASAQQGENQAPEQVCMQT